MDHRDRAKETFPEYYSPLSSNSFENGHIKASPCAFSTPKVTYSEDTRNFVNLLMHETRLTTTQRRGFESLLRSGDVAPEHPATALARRQEYLSRRVDKGRALGLQVPMGGLSVRKMRQMQFGLDRGKRTLETIQATSDDLKCQEQKPRKYIPVNKEAEKVRFSYKMTYGTDPSPDVLNRMMGVKSVNPKSVNDVHDESQKIKSDEDLKLERFNELIDEIRERVEFLDAMKLAKRDKEYSGTMIYQISQKLQEVKGLFPEKVIDLITKFRLAEIDPVFAPVS